MDGPLLLREEVADALTRGRPVVAIEATVLAGSAPVDERVAAALEFEATLRRSGAVPAMVGLADGRAVVGMTAEDKERLAAEPRIAKVGNRDLGATLASRAAGATTVSATLVVAESAGIRLLATGGVGGVHRRAPETFDISADLVQLSRTPVALVCAGAKSILDLGLTLEHLETLGVPVIGYRCDEFPAFYCRSSGLPNPARSDDPLELARVAAAHWAIGNRGGIMVTHPIAEEDALDAAEVESAIGAALAEADQLGITGQALSPRLLRAVDAATDGRSAAANHAVRLSVAAVAGELAVSLSDVLAAGTGGAASASRG